MSVEINDSAVTAAFNRLLKAGQQPAPMLDAVGSLLENKVRLGFHASIDPYGRPWAPLKSRSGKPLVNTGTHLRDRISYQVQGDTLTVGMSGPSWAPVHQYGATIAPKTKPALKFMVNGQWVSVKKVTIPARRMFPLDGLPDTWREDVLAELGDFIQKQIGG